MKLILYPNVEIWNFVLSGLDDREDIVYIPLNPNCSKLQILIRKLFPFSNLPSIFILGNKVINMLKKLEVGDSVIVADYSLPSIYHAIRRCCGKGVSINFWLWNPTSDDPLFEKKLLVLKKRGVIVSTFDSNDASQYKLVLKKQFYPILKYREDNYVKKKWDIYFLGCNKNRLLTIKEIKNMTSRYVTRFIMPKNLSEYITYADNIDNLRASRCIVDIVQDGQKGLTLRPLEACAFHVKLITNNKEIQSTSFYDPKNVFIYGIDAAENIEYFINTPYKPIEMDQIKPYDVNSWVDSF